MPNEVTRVGNLTRDPELRFTSSGKAICSFGMAWSLYNPETKTTNEPIFYEVTVWEQMGENVAESFSKGDRIIVIGRPESQEWEDKEGNKRITKKITASAIGPDMRWAKVTIVKPARTVVDPNQGILVEESF